jgi:hypothetical protein
VRNDLDGDLAVKATQEIRAAFWEVFEYRLLRSEAEAPILFDPLFPVDPFAR